MQDRLKCKVWSVEQKKMYSWSDCIKIGPNFIYGMFLDHRMLGKGIWLVRQCTGLKDKNGKQVYFDDLVRLPDGVIGKVAQIRDIDNIDYGRVVILPVANILNKVYQRVYVPTMIKYSEIIGNVYENPELLEEKQC